METVDPRELAWRGKKIELREARKGVWLPHLDGVALPGVQSVGVETEAERPRVCIITMRLYGDQFTLTPLASKPDAIDCLINLEWAGQTDLDSGGVEPSCPWCDVPKSDGVHSWACKLALLIDAPRADEPFDDEPRGAILR